MFYGTAHLRVEANILHKEPVGALADPDLQSNKDSKRQKVERRGKKL